MMIVRRLLMCWNGPHMLVIKINPYLMILLLLRMFTQNVNLPSTLLLLFCPKILARMTMRRWLVVMRNLKI